MEKISKAGVIWFIGSILLLVMVFGITAVGVDLYDKTIGNSDEREAHYYINYFKHKSQQVVLDEEFDLELGVLAKLDGTDFSFRFMDSDKPQIITSDIGLPDMNYAQITCYQNGDVVAPQGGKKCPYRVVQPLKDDVADYHRIFKVVEKK